MKLFLSGTVIATALIGALALPVNQNSSQNEVASKDGDKGTKQIFGVNFDLNLMKNTTLVPSPAFFNLSTGYGNGWDLGGGIVVPAVFPLSLFIPPFNLTYDINKHEQVSLDINAGAGNVSQAPGWTTPPPSTDQGWSKPTEGWSKPTEGWSKPTEGWTPPPPTAGWTTPGWTPPPPTAGWTTPGWAPPGWSKTQDENASSGNEIVADDSENQEDISVKGALGSVPNKPQNVIGVKPQPQPPSLQIAENAHTAEKNPGGGEVVVVSDVAHSTLSSELPAPDSEVESEAETDVSEVAAEEVEEKEMYNPVYYTYLNSGGSRPLANLASMAVFQDAIPGDTDKKKASGKTKRHVELQVEEDPESFADPEESEEQSENDDTGDLRKSPYSSEQGMHPISQNSGFKPGGKNKPRPFGMDKPSKSRPILGQDKNNRPNLIHSQKEEIPILDDSSSNDGTLWMGFQIPSINWSSFTDIFETFMGNRQLTTKTGAMAKMTRSSEAGDRCIEDEVEISTEVRTPKDEFEGGYLCGSGKDSENGEVKRNLCGKACAKNGFAGGSCVIRQDLMPGCLCRMPNSREYGMMLELFRQELNEEPIPVSLEASDAPAKQTTKSQAQNNSCKRCGCMEACKRDGSFTGFCAERCYCANPFYTSNTA